MRLHFFAAALLATLAASHAQAATPGEACLQDLRALPAFLLENDTGARQHLAQKGQAYFVQALDSASTAAAKVNDEAACNTVLSGYLSQWRKGHLQIMPNSALQRDTPPPASPPGAAPAPARDNRAPSLQLLSPHTALLTLPSFSPSTPGPSLNYWKASATSWPAGPTGSSMCGATMAAATARMRPCCHG